MLDHTDQRIRRADGIARTLHDTLGYIIEALEAGDVHYLRMLAHEDSAALTSLWSSLHSDLWFLSREKGDTP